MKMKLIALNFPSKKGLHTLDEVDKNNIYSDLCGILDIEDTAYMSPGAYAAIFCKVRRKMGPCMKRLSVVKITNPKNGKSIYRKYEYNPRFKGIGDNDVVLHPASIRELADGEENETLVGKTVCVRPGCKFCYYWNHPYHATRISMKLGIFSIAVAVISTILSLLFSCLCCNSF